MEPYSRREFLRVLKRYARVEEVVAGESDWATRRGRGSGGVSRNVLCAPMRVCGMIGWWAVWRVLSARRFRRPAADGGAKKGVCVLIVMHGRDRSRNKRL